MCTECKEPIKGKFFKDKETGKYLCISDYQVLNHKTSSLLILIYRPERKSALNVDFQSWKDTQSSGAINSTLSVLGFEQYFIVKIALKLSCLDAKSVTRVWMVLDILRKTTRSFVQNAMTSILRSNATNVANHCTQAALQGRTRS